MKIMKFFTLLLLAGVVMPLSLAGCDGGSDTPDTPAVPVPPESLSLAGADVSEYTIVYAPNYDDAFVSEFGEYLGDSYEHNKETAERLSKLIKDTLGVELSVVADDAAETAKEILIGATNRAQSAVTDVKDDAYVLRMSGEKLVIFGGSAGATYHAIDAIEKAFAETTVKNMAWDAATDLSGNCKMIRIACIGDSITEGSIGGFVNPDLAYPASLQRIYWKDYLVYNYGLGGTTMSSDSQKPYQSSEQYADCLGSGLTYDLILVMLGTNDSKVWGETYTEAQVAEYMQSCETLFAALHERSPKAPFLFMNCPVSYVTTGYGNPYMHAIQKSAAELMNTKGYETYLFNMYRFTTENMEREHFRDGLHPSYEGYRIMAAEIAEWVRVVLECDDHKYLIQLDY